MDTSAGRCPPLIVVSADASGGPMVGVPRYVSEIWPWVRNSLQVIGPTLPARRPPGLRLVWEQAALPAILRKRLLWSPAGTGPLAVERQVVTVHDVAALEHPEWFSRGLAAWYGFLVPRLLRRVRHVIAISGFTKRRLCALTDTQPNDVTVIHHGIHPRFKPTEESDVAQMRARLKIPQGEYLLSLCTLEPRKNLARLLRAWAHIEAQHPTFTLVLAGVLGSRRDFPRNRLELPRRTMLLGHVDDQLLPALYSGAAAMAYVSLYEGFGRPPLEAMACGTPVVCSRAGALPEVVGNCAVTVDPTDTQGIATAMRRVLDSAQLREELRNCGLARAAEFTWENAANETLAVLRHFAY